MPRRLILATASLAVASTAAHADLVLDSWNSRVISSVSTASIGDNGRAETSVLDRIPTTVFEDTQPGQETVGAFLTAQDPSGSARAASGLTGILTVDASEDAIRSNFDLSYSAGVQDNRTGTGDPLFNGKRVGDAASSAYLFLVQHINFTLEQANRLEFTFVVPSIQVLNGSDDTTAVFSAVILTGETNRFDLALSEFDDDFMTDELVTVADDLDAGSYGFSVITSYTINPSGSNAEQSILIDGDQFIEISVPEPSSLVSIAAFGLMLLRGRR